MQPPSWAGLFRAVSPRACDQSPTSDHAALLGPPDQRPPGGLGHGDVHGDPPQEGRVHVPSPPWPAPAPTPGLTAVWEQQQEALNEDNTPGEAAEMNGGGHDW